jgi:hypothetical protein
MSLTIFLAQLAMLPTLQAQPADPAPLMETRLGISAYSDTARARPRSVEVSDLYATRLTIHRYGSYAMLPLFGAQYLMGRRLIQQREDIFYGRRTEPVDAGLRRAHKYTAIGVGTLFVVNTTTGVWNLYDSRHTPEHRALRTLHAVTMLLADAGFVATGRLGVRSPSRDPSEGRRHRNFAIGSMSIATAGASLMWFVDH